MDFEIKKNILRRHFSSSYIHFYDAIKPVYKGH